MGETGAGSDQAIASALMSDQRRAPPLLGDGARHRHSACNHCAHDRWPAQRYEVHALLPAAWKPLLLAWASGMYSPRLVFP